ncbi:hypothetical protein GKR71_00055 [Providencia sp. wls1922]|uniref:hypothetical protein n=1 Tax=Providencia sp. wls1922 TaxID=2675152 RepID=UPI0012B5063E|nr:hypothetical protein [Providencia sp. wls1922]MTC44232.1 hypothetical protein [Providencia sp. wls1922]
MKTNYFTYRYLPVDGYVPSESLKDTIDSMISSGNNTANMAGEYYVIQPVAGDVYTFIKTNSRDVFRKLDLSNNICVDLSQILTANEKIAFASFFIIKSNLIGFSNTLYSPRIGKLAEIYDLVMLARNNNHNINFEPIANQVTEQEVLNYAHVGRITMKLDKSQNLIDRLGTLFAGNVSYDDVDSFEIKIIPKRTKDIKDTFSGVMNAMPQEVTSVAVSAKEHIGDVATDLNVIMSNTVCDFVNISSTTAINIQMENNYTNNSTLRNLGY